jgi:Spy/CpxP family protein refolding chaperone
MKHNWIAIALATSALLAGTASAQPGYGPGMMGGNGPGMMGGYGAGGYGGGYGHGMMGGYGGMGPGMMGGPNGGLDVPDLTADQRSKIRLAQQDFWKKQWPLMQQMHATMWDEGAGGFDEQAARKNYEAASALHKQMFENGLEMRKRVDAVLTPKQKEQLRR